MSLHTSPPQAVPEKNRRQPRQSRGEARVTAILDAVERLLIEEGEPAVTMHRVAAEAQTSIGSLYHFFPDKPGLLSALSERHEAAVGTLVAEIDKVPDDTWRAADAGQVVALMMMPLLDYIAAHPGVLNVIRLDRSAGKTCTDSPVQPVLQTLCQRILSLRLPAVSELRRDAYAATLLGIPLGLVTELMVDYQPAMRRAVMEEIPRALVAYLTAIEQPSAR